MTITEPALIYSSRTYDLFLEKGCVMHYRIRPNVSFKLEDAKDYMGSGLVIEKVFGQDFPTITSVRGFLAINKEARDYMRDFEEADRFILANAIVVESNFLKGLVLFILKLIKPLGSKHPKQIFTDLNGANSLIDSIITRQKWISPRVNHMLLMQAFKSDLKFGLR